MKKTNTDRRLGMAAKGMLSTTALVMFALPGWGNEPIVSTSVEGCNLIEGALPGHCAHPGAGTVVVMPDGANTTENQTPLDGNYGFSIVVDAAVPDAPRTQIAGDEVSLAPRADAVAAQQALRDAARVDRILAATGVQVSFDGLDAQTFLTVAVDRPSRAYAVGDVVTFSAVSNYPAWIKTAEIRVSHRGAPRRVIARIPISANGQARWTMPAGAPENMEFRLRVSDASGQFDETFAVPLSRIEGTKLPQAEPATSAAPKDMTRRRAIPVAGGAVTVRADHVAPGTSLMLLGERVALGTGTVEVQRILPPGVHDVRIGAGRGAVRRAVEVPASDWFYVALADLTVAHDLRANTTDTTGRLAGFVKGQTAGGTRVTASIDTGTQPLKDVFRDVGRKDPHAVLKRIEADDLYPTYGDGSTITELAPTSGGLYLEVEHRGARVLWGDFKADEDVSRLVRGDRTLYGLQASYDSPVLTERGDSRLRISGYAAQPDRLLQRDELSATGGSAFFLSRRDVLPNTEKLVVQYRDKVSGNILRTDRLREGVDYRINYFEGVIQLSRPIDPVLRGGGVITEGASDVDVALVASYEYRPALGEITGESMGARAEAWLTDDLRLGYSVQQETTGLAQNKLQGVDLLYQRSENTYARLDFAQSEGPGFGRAASENGGLDMAQGDSSGLAGRRARAQRAELRLDLGELSAGAREGAIAAWYDHKEAGFVSADYDIKDTQTDYGLDADVAVNDRLRMMMAYQNFQSDSGKQVETVRVGAEFALSEALTLAGDVQRTDRTDPSAVAQRNGQRVDAGVKLTYRLGEERAAWVFAQRSLSTSGGIARNDRYGIGARARLSDRWLVEGELSDGTQGVGAALKANYDTGTGTQLHIGYVLDPERALDRAGFTGADNGTLTLGADTQVSDTTRYRGETIYDLFGERRSITHSYGMTVTPTNRWSFDTGIIVGQSWQSDGSVTTRRGVSGAVTYNQDDKLRAAVSADIRREENDANAQLGRVTYGVQAMMDYRLDPNWTALARLDALVSENDQDALRDGRYVEASMGFAYRPVDNERLNALVRYTWLDDLPGADQSNAEGKKNGPGQRSHILSADVHYDLSQTWSVAGKFGYRDRVLTPRDGSTGQHNRATLLALRADYHLVHNWDLMGEVRMMQFHDRNVTERGALAGVWRHLGNNAKLGIGYQWGDVSDDLRRIEGRQSGVFFNLVGKF